MSKAIDFINNKCYQLGNPVEPLIFKADALEAVRIASKEMEDKAIEATRVCALVIRMGNVSIILTTKNKVVKYVIWNVIV